MSTGLLCCLALMAASFGAAQNQPAAVKPASPTEAEVIVLTRHGFQPKAVKRPAGAFLLSLRNATELASLEFSILDSTGKAVIPDITLGRSMEAGWHSVLNLSPGTYRVTIKQLPAYTMSITITN